MTNTFLQRAAANPITATLTPAQVKSGVSEIKGDLTDLARRVDRLLAQAGPEFKQPLFNLAQALNTARTKAHDLL